MGKMPATHRFRLHLGVTLTFTIGVIVGGYVFAKTQPRSVLSLNNCVNCLRPNELAGLVGSVIVNQTLIIIKPLVIMETDKTIVIKNPKPEASVDYVVIPKKDIFVAP